MKFVGEIKFRGVVHMLHGFSIVSSLLNLQLCPKTSLKLPEMKPVSANLLIKFITEFLGRRSGVLKCKELHDAFVHFRKTFSQWKPYILYCRTPSWQIDLSNKTRNIIILRSTNVRKMAINNFIYLFIYLWLLDVLPRIWHILGSNTFQKFWVLYTRRSSSSRQLLGQYF